jgi:iron complex transport system permease protein
MVVLALVGVLTGAAVAVAGLVSFVGLVSPHVARSFVGDDHRFLVPSSALTGAILVTSADLIARLIIRPAEIPMGILTAAVGAPFLLYLVRFRR